jgi:hypothetical protein
MEFGVKLDLQKTIKRLINQKNYDVLKNKLRNWITTKEINVNDLIRQCRDKTIFIPPIILNKLGMLFSTGKEGLTEDAELAFHFYLLAADLGYPSANGNVASYYFNGRAPGGKNLSLSFFYCKKAIELGCDKYLLMSEILHEKQDYYETIRYIHKITENKVYFKTLDMKKRLDLKKLEISCFHEELKTQFSSLFSNPNIVMLIENILQQQEQASRYYSYGKGTTTGGYEGEEREERGEAAGSFLQKSLSLEDDEPLAFADNGGGGYHNSSFSPVRSTSSSLAIVSPLKRLDSNSSIDSNSLVPPPVNENVKKPSTLVRIPSASLMSPTSSVLIRTTGKSPKASGKSTSSSSSLFSSVVSAASASSPKMNQMNGNTSDQRDVTTTSLSMTSLLASLPSASGNQHLNKPKTPFLSSYPTTITSISNSTILSPPIPPSHHVSQQTSPLFHFQNYRDSTGLIPIGSSAYNTSAFFQHLLPGWFHISDELEGFDKNACLYLTSKVEMMNLEAEVMKQASEYASSYIHLHLPTKVNPLTFSAFSNSAATATAATIASGSFSTSSSTVTTNPLDPAMMLQQAGHNEYYNSSFIKSCISSKLSEFQQLSSQLSFAKQSIMKVWNSYIDLSEHLLRRQILTEKRFFNPQKTQNILIFLLSKELLHRRLYDFSYYLK